MPLSVSSNEMPDGANALKTMAGGMVTKVVAGAECSMVYAVREAGYHSRPHHHVSEQLTYVVDGEIWVFVDDDGFLCRAGDFFRVPAHAVHWGWNRSDQPVTTLQVHAPPLEPSRPNVVLLAAEGEQIEPRGDSRNIAIDDPAFAATEARVIAEHERISASGSS